MLMCEAVEKIRKTTGINAPDWVLEKVVDEEAQYIDKVKEMLEENASWSECVDEAVHYVIHWTHKSPNEFGDVLPKDPKEVRKIIEMAVLLRRGCFITKLLSHYHSIGGTWY